LILKRGTDDRDDVCGFPQRKSGRGGGCQEDVRRELNQLSCQDRQLLEMAAAKRYTMLRFRPSSYPISRKPPSMADKGTATAARGAKLSHPISGRRLEPWADARH